MKINKLHKLIFLSFIITITITIIISSKKKKKESSELRKTQYLEYINYICLQSNDNLLPLYNEISFPYKDNILTIYSKALIDYIYSGDTKYLKDKYLTRVSRYLIILLLIIIIIISYLICWLCCCCPCCCCKQKEDENCCRQFSLLIAIIMSGSLISSGYYGMSMEYKIMGNINGLTCSVYKFIINVFEGDQCSMKPIWSGFYQISDSIRETDNIINNVASINKNLIKNDIEKVNQMEFYKYIKDKDKFLKEEKLKYENLSNLTFNNPDPRNNNVNVIPDFIFENTDKLNNVVNDFENIVNQPFKILKENSEYIKKVNSNRNNIISSFNKSLKKLQQFRNTFKYFANDAVRNWVKYHKSFMKYGDAFFSFFFPICMIIGGINIFCLLFYVTFNFQWTRIPMYVLWNVETIIMIISFIFGLIFSLIYVEGKDGRDIIDYSLSFRNLRKNNSIIFKGEGKEYLNICLNEDGNLEKSLELNNNDVLLLNSFYNYIDILEKEIKVCSQELENLEKYIKESENYLDYIDNSYYYSNGEKKEFKDILNELRKYSDSSFDNNYIENNKEITDVWVFSKKNCPKNYKYMSINDKYIIKKKNCLVLLEWKDLPEIYSEILTKKGNYDNLKLAIESFNETLISYLNYSQEILNENITPIYKEYYDNLTIIKNIVKNDLGEIYIKYYQFKDLYGKYINENESIFSFVNCRFMRRDVNIFLYQMDKLSDNSGKLASINYTVSFSLMLCILFFFFVIMRYLKEKRKIDIDDEAIDFNSDTVIPIPENQSENKQIEDLVNNQNRFSINQES